MKKVWKYLKNHWKEDFDIGAYFSVVVLLSVAITVNYIIDFEDSILDQQRGLTKFLFFLLFYSIPYYVTVFMVTRSFSTTWSPAFILKSMVGLSVLSLDASLPFLRSMLLHVDVEIYYWLYKIAVNLVSVLTVVLPLYFYYRFADLNREGFYGLAPRRFDASPYFQMLLVMLPLLIAATWLPGFLKQYPMYKPNLAHEYLGVPAFVTALAYELAYAIDFVTVELLFRGFMVIGLSAFLGRRAVISMVVIYCFLHFGKPAGEAISSAIGGYILGVVAYETRSIWGGVIVHIGIAWMMEILSFLAKQL